jgi:hypothetical protein
MKPLSLEDLEQQHEEQFGYPPKYIGLHWNDEEGLIVGLHKSLLKGKPFNEYDMLSAEEKVLYDENRLIF